MLNPDQFHFGKDLFGNPPSDAPKDVPVEVKPKDFITVFHSSYDYVPPHTQDHPDLDLRFNNFSSNQSNDIIHAGTLDAASGRRSKVFHMYEIPKSLLDVTYADSDSGAMSSNFDKRRNHYGPPQQSLWETTIKTPKEVHEGNLVVPYLNQWEDKGSLSYMIPKHLIHSKQVRYAGMTMPNVLKERGIE
jgi:hypothetical protein